MLRVVALALFLVCQAGAQDYNLDLIHAVETETIYESSDVRHGLDEAAWIYKPRLRFDRGALTAEMELDFRFDGYYQWGKDDFTEGERDQQETQITTRNFWLSYVSDKWDLTFGKQILRWGYTTGVRPVIDVVNAQDRRSPFSQIQDNPIGEAMARFEYYGKERVRFSAFALFDKQTDEVPVFDSRYNAVPLPWEDKRNTELEGGLRLEYEFENNGRMAFMGASLTDNAAVYRSLDAENLEATFERYEIAGFSFLAEALQGTFKADLAYSFDKAFTTLDTTGADFLNSDFFHGRVYYDNMSIPNLTLSGGYSYSQVLSHDGAMLQPETSELFYLDGVRELIDWNSILSLNLQKSVGQGANLGNDATTATLTFTYIGIDNLQLSLLMRKVYRSTEDLPFENGVVFVGKYFF